MTGHYDISTQMPTEGAQFEGTECVHILPKHIYTILTDASHEVLSQISLPLLELTISYPDSIFQDSHESFDTLGL